MRSRLTWFSVASGCSPRRLPRRIVDQGERTRRRWFRLLLVLLACSLGSNYYSALRAQEPAASTTAENEDAGAATDVKVVPDQDEPVRRKIKPDEPKWRLLAQVDKAFAKAVSYMDLVLFYRIGAEDRPYVEFDRQEIYFRPVGSEGSFIELNPIGPGPRKLTPSDRLRLQAQDKLILAGTEDGIQKGLLDENARVEFVVVRQKTAKYVLDDGVYRRALPTRDRLSDDDVLSLEEVEQAAAEGELRVDEDREGETRAWLHTEEYGGAPLVVLWLSLGAVFFTIYMRGYNFIGFRHAIDIVRGKYDNPDEPGEVTHFQALASALSATVGLGNIAGVTIAMTMGGPGAFFWMMACGLFGMSSKLVECTLGQKYRQVRPDGTVLGGPMQYLHEGLKELGLGRLGLVLSLVFAVMCIMASFGGGNMFQANQSGQQMLAMLQMHRYQELADLRQELKQAADSGDDERVAELHAERAKTQNDIRAFQKWFLPVYGVVLAAMVAMVIIGGIKRIGAAASKVVPTMCLVYLAACLWIIFRHLPEVPELVVRIFTEAFNPKAFGGGMLGVLVVGVRRAAFSNEAGVGSAAIAHSAAKTDEPVREGTVAMMGPFIDTVVVCSMTALVILITGAWNNEAWVVDQGLVGTPLTSKAFEEEISWFPYVLSVAVVLFAYSTLISWSYYGEKCWERLFGARSTILYKALYVSAVFVGAVVNLGSVLDFSDMMILSMAFPNILGLILLSPKVRRDLVDYWARYKAGTFKTFK